VHNLWVQDYCATDSVEHLSLTYDHTVENALDPTNPQTVGC
jgi:hypothetical protein